MKWDHFQDEQQLQARTKEGEMPIIRKIWGYDRDEDTRIGITFLFYKKTDPIPADEAKVQDGSTLLDYLVYSPANI